MPGLVRDWEDALIRPVLALEELPVWWVDRLGNNLQCVKAQKLLLDICLNRVLNDSYKLLPVHPTPTPTTP